MGIMTRQHGTDFVIASDHDSNEVGTKRASKRPFDVYNVWTGTAWTAVREQAKTFDSLDAADDYVRANYPRLSASAERAPTPK